VQPVIAFQDPLGQLPPPASTFAGEVDSLFYFLVWVSLASFGLILAALLYSSIVHRRKTEDQPAASNVTHSTTLEVVWTLIPTVVVMVAFAWGLKGNLQQQVAPAGALQYRVEAFKWGWRFYHPGSTVVSEHLYVPVNTPVKFTMTSEDVLHSFFVPAMRAKRDVVPGVRQIVWFEATELNGPVLDAQGELQRDEYGNVKGGFDLFCAEYCGDGHSLMRRKVFVVSQEEFATKPWDKLPEDPVGRGEFYFKINCIACHSLDGSRLVGPSFKGIWEREGRLEGGASYVADEAYLRESIRNPLAKIVETYPAGVMPVFGEGQLSDEAVGDIIEWMKTLK
jgi:cytochrome c oxidase subunit 2